jgi:hypothetical protein
VIDKLTAGGDDRLIQAPTTSLDLELKLGL